MIIQINDSNKIKEYNLENFGKSIISFGRHKTNDIVIEDINASREHGYFKKNNHEWFVCDNNSTNGIVVNGDIINEKKLYTNDSIVLSVKKQDRAVHIKIINDEYNVSDRVDNPRSMSRYFRMTNDMSDVLTVNTSNNISYQRGEENTTLLHPETFNDSEESTSLLNPNGIYPDSEESTTLLHPNYNNTNDYTVYHNSNYIDRSIIFPNNNDSLKKDNKKGKKIALISGIAALIVSLIILGIVFMPKLVNGKSDNNYSNDYQNDTEEISIENTETEYASTTEVVEEIQFEAPYLVDYSILANILEYEDISNYEDPYNMEPGPYMPNEIIDGFEVYDIDDDGIDELLIKTSLVIYNTEGPRKVLYTFDAVDGNFTEWRDVSTDGESDLYICENDNKAYLHEDYYTAGYTYESYNIWTAEGWAACDTFKKEKDKIVTSKWGGKDVSEDEWFNNCQEMNLRDISDNISDLTYIKIDLNPKNTADSIYNYYKNYKKLNAFLIKNDSKEEYYIVLNKYSNTWKNQKNLDYAYEDYTFADFYSDPLVVISVSEDKSGSSINIYLIYERQDVADAKYDNGIIITDNGIEYLYDIKNGQIEYIKKLTLDDIETKLIAKKWYTLNSGNKAEIKEYVFRENGEAELIEYNYDNGKWIEGLTTVYKYTYYPDEKKIYINFGQDGFDYYYDSNYGVFIGDLTYFNYDGTNNYYEKCLISYDDFPDFNTLNNNCHNILSGNPIDEVEQVTTEQESVNNSGVLTQDQVYQAIVNYCCEQNPSLNDIMGDDSYTFYWVIGELEGDYYTVDYRSYTAAHVYYHVNIYTGEVYTTEYVPGITDGEVPGGESFNIWSYVN